MTRILIRLALVLALLALGTFWLAIELRQMLLVSGPPQLPFEVVINGQNLAALWEPLHARLMAMEPQGQLGVAATLGLALVAAAALVPLLVLGLLLYLATGVLMVLGCLVIPAWLGWLLLRRLLRHPPTPGAVSKPRSIRSLDSIGR